MVISGPTPRAQDSNADHPEFRFNTVHLNRCDGHIRSFANDGLHGIRWRGGRLVRGMCPYDWFYPKNSF
jgi:hypothetical protein